MWKPSDAALQRIDLYPLAFDRIVEIRDGETITAYCAAGMNTPLWQKAVFTLYGLYPEYDQASS